MKFLRKVWSHWQGLSALFAAVAVFVLSPFLLRWIDPTAGTFDVGYLQRPLVALVYLLFGAFGAFVVFQIDFPSVDKWLDKDTFFGEWQFKLTPRERIFGMVLIYFGLLAAYIACLFAVPLPI